MTHGLSTDFLKLDIFAYTIGAYRNTELLPEMGGMSQGQAHTTLSLVLRFRLLSGLPGVPYACKLNTTTCLFAPPNPPSFPFIL